MNPAQGQLIVEFSIYLNLFSLMGCLMIYLRVRKDRNELEKEQAEKKADILRMSSTREGRNMDNIFLPKPKDKWLIRHNKLNEVVSTDDEDTVRSTLEEVQRYSKRLEKKILVSNF